MIKVDVKYLFYQQTSPVKKHGLGSASHQRYRCQACCRSFQLEYEYRVCNPGMKEKIVGLTMNNVGIRDTARALIMCISPLSEWEKLGRIYCRGRCSSKDKYTI